MKIELEIPDRYQANSIRVFAGIEEIAHKHPNEDTWKVKIQSCSRCGKCCDDCEFLIKESDNVFVCDKGFKIPFECVQSDGYKDGCTIKWQEV